MEAPEAKSHGKSHQEEKITSLSLAVAALIVRRLQDSRSQKFA